MSKENLEIKSIAPPKWKIWLVTLVGTLATAIFTVSRSIGAGDEFVDLEDNLASAIGGGIAVSLLICFVTYFIVFRHTAKRTKWLAFAAFLFAGISGGIMSTSL